MKLVVIGGVAAGMSAASKAKRINKDISVEVYTDEEYISYAGCGLPYYAQGLIPVKDKLVARTPEQFAKQNIQVYRDHRVIAIRPQEKQITVETNDGQTKYVDYDRLIIATGARPVTPDFYQKNMQNVFTVKSIPSIVALRELMQKGQPKKAVIIGGGYIGLEMAEAILEWKIDLTVIQLPDQLLRSVDPEMSKLIEMHLIDKGVKVRTKERVIGLEGSGKVEKVITDKGEIEADLVVLAVGIIPNSELARDAGIELGVRNAIKVNRSMETNIPDIYAAGDCATAYHLVLKGDSYIPLGTTANKQGRIAGENAAGGRSIFQGIVGTSIIKVLDLEIGRTGLNSEEALRAGFKFRDIKIEDHTRAHYYPGGNRITIKLLINEENDVIIGAQLVGGSGAGKRIDVLAAAVQLGLTPNQLSELDLSYAPPFSPVWDPVLVAANAASK